MGTTRKSIEVATFDNDVVDLLTLLPKVMAHLWPLQADSGWYNSWFYYYGENKHWFYNVYQVCVDDVIAGYCYVKLSIDIAYPVEQWHYEYNLGCRFDGPSLSWLSESQQTDVLNEIEDQLIYAMSAIKSAPAKQIQNEGASVYTFADN